MSNPEHATRVDPYGKFGHVEPTTLEEAARMYREALAFSEHRIPDNVKERVKLIQEAEHRLKEAAFSGRLS